MAIVISGVNNNDKITASDGTIDLLSGVNYAGIITAPAFTSTGNITAASINVGSGIQVGNAGIITATTLIGNVTGNINHTSNLLLQISGSEKFRVGTSGQLGIGGANYGTSGQVLTSGGSGSAATWSTPSTPAVTGFTNGADNRVVTATSGSAITGEVNLTFNGGATGDAQLTVHAEQNDSGADSELILETSNDFATSVVMFKDSTAEAGSVAYNHGDNYLKFSTNGTNGGTERFRIHSAGQIGLSGANYGTSGQVLTSAGSGSAATWSTVSTQDTLSFRNIIINGAMIISQRGTSVASSGYQTVDRWQFSGSWPGSAITQEQANVGYNSAPYDQGFRKSYKLTNSNQGSVAAGSNIEITYSFEGQEIANSGWDYVSSSKKITLSFWIKSSVAQTFYGYFRTFSGVDMKYSFPIVCSTTDWEYKTVSIVGEGNFAENVQNSFPNTTGRAMVLRIVPYYGTSYTDAGSVSNAWQNYSAGVITPVYATSWFLTNGSTFELTGVQLEVGDTATSFEHRSHGDELRRCQRYYQKDLSRNRRFWGSGNVAGRQFPVRFDVEMRDTPSVSFTSTSVDSGSLSASGINRQGYYTDMSGSGRFYEWQHTADAEM